MFLVLAGRQGSLTWDEGGARVLVVVDGDGRRERGGRMCVMWENLENVCVTS